MSTRSRLGSLTPLWIALGACTGGDLEPTTDPASADAPTERVAIVSLTWRSGEPGLAQAYVVDHAPGERKATLDLLGVPTAGLLLESSIADQCRVERATNALSTSLLRDAGEILVSTGDAQQVLDFTWLPEGTLGASGAAYSALVPGFPSTTEGTKARNIQTKPRVIAVSADGSHEVGAFTASTLLPEEVHLLSVGGRAVRSGRVPRDPAQGSLDVASLASDLEVIWARSPQAPKGRSDEGIPQELTLVVFERVGFGETWTIACASEDDGAFSIPAAALLTLPDLGAYQTDRVVVRRVAGASFSARSLPEGLLLVTSEDQAYLE